MEEAKILLAKPELSPRSPRSGGLHPPCSGPARPEHRPAAASRRSLQACIASLPLQSSWMSKTYLKSDHFNGGGSVGPRRWEGADGSRSLFASSIGTQNPELGPNSRDRDPAGQILTDHCHKEPSGSTNSARSRGPRADRGGGSEVSSLSSKWDPQIGSTHGECPRWH